MLIAASLRVMFSDEGNREFRKEEEQDTHTLCEVRPPQLPFAEEPLLRLRLSRCSQEDIANEVIRRIIVLFNTVGDASFLGDLDDDVYKCSDNWSVKAIRRKTTGTGRMRYLRNVPRRFKTNFREGTEATPRKKAAAVSA
ncbi:hypothetical protein SASPL_156003 [Salvia splendens]|uniref:Large subunit ribosomal protein L37e n=1 Tax=Salvia splendens TaxID=180675 RepID=A0A8X8VXH3_SALSN|nr:hypothetical protein SASPL_156003 [Salvia splendens]